MLLKFDNKINEILEEGRIRNALAGAALGASLLTNPAIGQTNSTPTQQNAVNTNYVRLSTLYNTNRKTNGAELVQQRIYNSENPAFNNYVQDLINSEGVEDHTYYDSENKLSWGIGFNIEEPHIQGYLGKYYRILLKKGYIDNPRESDLIMRAVFRRSLDQAIADAAAYVNGNNRPGEYDKLPTIVQLILTDMSYNMGGERLKGFVKLRKHILDRNWDGIVTEMTNSIWYINCPNDRAKNWVRNMRYAADEFYEAEAQ